MKPEENEQEQFKEDIKPMCEEERDTQSPKRPEILCCPECGSSRIRKRSLYFFISITVFVGLLFLKKMMAVDYQHGLFDSHCEIVFGLIVIFILYFWPAVIFGAVCFAFVGRHRCLNCRNRFRTTSMKGEIKKEVLFPWRYSIFNGIIIFIILIVSGNIYMLKSHVSISMITSMILIEGLFATFPTAFLIILSLLYQTIVHRFLRTRLRSTLLWAALFLMSSIALGGDLYYKHLPKVAANRILSHGELAHLPVSATNIKIYTWSTPMSGEEFLRFCAPKIDIEKFLETSPILKNKEGQRYSKDKMRLPYSRESFENINENISDTHDYFSPEAHAPDWYIEEIRGPGRRYNFKSKRYHYPREVIVDDEKNLVFVYLCFD